MANVHGRESGVMLDRVLPEELLLITDPEHPLRQRRAEVDPPEWFVDSIRRNGVQEAIIVRRGAAVRGLTRLEVVDGRQRVRGARIVNVERRAAGLMPITIKCDIFRGSDADAARLVALLNEHRVPVDARTKAETAAQALKYGASEQQVCNDNNWTRADLRRHLDLLECVPEVQEAVQAGRLALAAVPQLRRLERAEQAVQVAALAAEGKVTAREAGAAVAKSKPEVRAPKMRPRKQIERKLRELTEGVQKQGPSPADLTPPAVLAVLRWVLGEAEELDL